MDIRKEVLLAYERIRPHIRQTPLEFSPFYSPSAEAQVYFKLENVQLTGSFKLRGVVTASTGNHGTTAVALVAFLKMGKRLKGQNVVVVICGSGRHR